MSDSSSPISNTELQLVNDKVRSPERRKLLKGVAWSAPVIATAVAVPAAAASSQPSDVKIVWHNITVSDDAVANGLTGNVGFGITHAWDSPVEYVIAKVAISVGETVLLKQEYKVMRYGGQDNIQFSTEKSMKLVAATEYEVVVSIDAVDNLGRAVNASAEQPNQAWRMNTVTIPTTVKRG